MDINLIVCHAIIGMLLFISPHNLLFVLQLPVVFMIAIAMLTFTVLMPGENFAEQLGSLLFWGGASVTSLLTIWWYGTDFVDRPKLCTDKDKDV